MNKPKWLSRENVEYIHKTVVNLAGGSHGLRDASLLESALARAKNQHAYGENDIFQLAAAYAEGIARNHPFIDGNKRTAFEAADIFLYMNGYELLQATRHEHAEMMERLSQGQISKKDAARHFRDHATSLNS